jgi:taurine dioxygenase
MQSDTASTIRSVTPFGVVAAASLVLNPDDAARVGLRLAFEREGLVVVRGLALDMAGQMEACRIFGPVIDTPWENFVISNARGDGYLGAQQLLWHNDLTYLPRPYLGGSLHALEVAQGATSTRFASALRAYERLPKALRERIEPLNALHVKQKVFDRPNRLTDLEPGDVCAVHPVVRRQPGTGRPYLFVSEDLTDSIIGLSRADSDDLLAELFACFYADGEVCEHSWRTGDLVIWDNLTVQHARGRISSATRTLQRVSIADLGYAQMYPTDLGIYSGQYDMTLAPGTGAATG